MCGFFGPGGPTFAAFGCLFAAFACCPGAAFAGAAFAFGGAAAALAPGVAMDGADGGAIGDLALTWPPAVTWGGGMAPALAGSARGGGS